MILIQQLHIQRGVFKFRGLFVVVVVATGMRLTASFLTRNLQTRHGEFGIGSQAKVNCCAMSLYDANINYRNDRWLAHDLKDTSLLVKANFQSNFMSSAR